MKINNYKFYLKILFVLSVVVLFFIFLQSYYGGKPKLNNIGTARLTEDGSEVRIFTGKYAGGLGLIFLFSDKYGDIINTLLVENLGLEGPSFRIVKGNTHDWLVVTTINNWGTGMIEKKDIWYLVKSTYGGVLKVLSYSSLKGDYSADSSSTEITADVSNIQYKKDDALDIKYITKTCDANKNCKISSGKTDHFVWQNNTDDENKNGFVLNP